MNMNGCIVKTSSPCFISPSSQYTPHYRDIRDIRRHPISSNNQPSSTLFGGLESDLHDLSRPSNIKPDVSMYHVMPSRPHELRTHELRPHEIRSHELRHELRSHEMHDFLDPMSTHVLADPNLYSNPHTNGMSYPPLSSGNESLLVNGMMIHPNTSHFHTHQDGLDTDPRELESFAERFKQRRIKLGVTQADVGRALANLKLPGVGSLSQSTICRFESLTLSHNNMVALKPILQAWLEAAEAQARKSRTREDSVLPSSDKKRKRTSIAAPEKRSLENFFALQPRPSGEKIAAIAEKLDLKKNVVRVWFCNQRQKQKRMKYSAVNGCNP